MTGEIEYFRKQFFGGFNQQDVIDYITKLSRERHDLSDALNKSEKDMQLLAGVVASLRLELEDAKRTENAFRENMDVAVALSFKFFRELETAFDRVFQGIEAATINARDELEAAADAVAKLPSTLVSAVEMYGELKNAFDAVTNSGAGSAEQTESGEWTSEQAEPDAAGEVSADYGQWAQEYTPEAAEGEVIPETLEWNQDHAEETAESEWAAEQAEANTEYQDEGAEQAVYAPEPEPEQEQE